MTFPLLVVTPNPGFGQLIQQVLEQTGNYAVRVAGSGQQAVTLTDEQRPALCLVDCELQDPPLHQLAGVLRDAAPELLLVMIPADNDQDDSLLDSINADGYLAKPFYLPDLITTVKAVIDQSGIDEKQFAKPKKKKEALAEQKQTSSDTTPAPAWLQDVNVAARYLARLSIESAAQASIVTRGAEIYAYAGELDKDAAEELARTVDQYWDGVETAGDLARFVRLESNSGEYMLYATAVGSDFVLAMAFDTETPFSKMRNQAADLAQALASTPPEGLGDTRPEELIIQEEDTEPLIHVMEPLLDDVPPPIPNDWLPEKESAGQMASFMDEIFEEAPRSDSFSNETSPALRREELPLPVELALDDVPADTEQALPEAIPLDEYQAETMPSRIGSEDYLMDTVVSESDKGSKDAKGKIKLDPVSPAMHNLSYACLLIPRLPNHFLTGDVANNMSDWVSQLCLAFGWRLEQLSIRPEYLQWVVVVPPNTTPGYLMRIIRQHTSRRIFVEFPRLEEDNPSGDFWAPGYLILSGMQTPPPQLVKDFIKETRRLQGISGE